MSPANSWSFLIDENLPRPMSAALRASGYSAEHVFEVGLSGQPDPDIFAYAQAHRRTVISGDMDLANSTRFPPPHAGIIILRLPNSASTPERIQEVLGVLSQLSGQMLADTLVTVQKGRYRVRH
jgi:predicted nuclease of predicted toxin-antitoxin system